MFADTDVKALTIPNALARLMREGKTRTAARLAYWYINGANGQAQANSRYVAYEMAKNGPKPISAKIIAIEPRRYMPSGEAGSTRAYSVDKP